MKKRSATTFLFSTLAYTILIFTAFITLIPIFWMVCASFKTNEDFFSSLFLPMKEMDSGAMRVAWERLTLSHFYKLFTELNFGRAILNSCFFASVASVVGTLFCAMGGFALSKYTFKFREALTTMVLVALIIPGPLLMAPGYQWIYTLGLLDTYTGLILPGAATAFGVFLFRQSMLNTIPGELMEAARIDGCGEIRMFFTVVLPLVKPTIGAFLLITFLGNWNNFIGPQIILQTADKFPLSVSLAQLKGMYSQDYGMIMAGMFVSVMPVVAIFLFLQNEFVSGLTAGSVKG